MNFIQKNLPEVLDILLSSIKITLGPTGKSALLSNFKKVHFVDDGITILKELKFTSRYKNLLLNLVKQASLRTDKIVGDGTTTTALLTCLILQEASKYSLLGIKSFEMAIGIKKLATVIIQKIKQFSFPLKKKVQILSLLDTTMGSTLKYLNNHVYEALLKKGKQGVIQIEESLSFQSELISMKVVEGFQLDKGILSPYFLKDPKYSFTELINPYLLITDLKIHSFDQIREIVEHSSRKDFSLLLIASHFEKHVLSTLIINNLNNDLKVIPLKTPFFGLKQKLVLEDLSFVTTAKFISSSIFEESYRFKFSDLGQLQSAKVYKYSTLLTFFCSSKVNIQRRINHLKRDFEKNDGVYEKELVNQRIKLLSGSMVKILLSSSNSSEASFLKYKVQDGINSLNSSFQEGVTICSSSLFIHLIDPIRIWSFLNLINDEIFSYYMIQKGFISIFFQLCENTNIVFSTTFDFLIQKGYPLGFDFKNQKFFQLKDKFILDSSKMLRIIILNSFSVVSSVLLSF